MANTTPAKYTVQLGPTVTPEVAAELATLAQLLGVSNSQITRECIERGLAAGMAGRKGWRVQLDEQHGGPEETEKAWGRVYDAHLEHFQRRGTRQTSRRREYDRTTRGAAPSPVTGVHGEAVA